MIGEHLTIQRGTQTFSALSWGKGDETVLCLHGFPDTRETFGFQVEALCKAGFRVVTPVMRGYENSSVSPDGHYYVHDLAEDVLEWITALGVEKAHLVGHDWGAVTAGAVGALAPDRVGSLSLLAVPYGKHFLKALRAKPSQILNSWYMLFFQLGTVAEEVVAKNEWEFIERLWKDWSPGWVYPEKSIQSVKVALSQPGVLGAALGYYRCAFQFWNARGLRSMRLLRRPISVPTLGLIGELDGCIGPEFYGICMQEDIFTNGLSVKTIAGAGHFLQQEKPEAINEHLLEWLQSHPLS